MRIIINADDFGKDKEVNEAICACFEKGLITGTTLMVNMPGTDDAVRLAMERGFADRIGLHINLTTGFPLTDDMRRYPVFCDSEGRFNAAFHLSTRTRLWLGAQEEQAVKKELKAQLDRYRGYGFRQAHVDSHHHVHTDMSVWRELRLLLSAGGVRSVRLGRNVYGGEKVSAFNKLYKTLLNDSIKREGVGFTDYFGSFDDLADIVSRMPGDAIAELMVHPVRIKDGRIFGDDGVPMDEIKESLEASGCEFVAY